MGVAGVLRVFFTDRDLARLRVATGPEVDQLLRHHTARANVPPRGASAAQVEAVRSRWAKMFLNHGAAAVLGSLGPTVRWRPPVLEADQQVAQEIELAGRGLILVPAIFRRAVPVALIERQSPPVLVYPLEPVAAGGHAAGATLASPAGKGPLDALLGATRAAVLSSIDVGCTTGELARRLGVSAASASQHSSVLRDAGLIMTRRDRGAVLHTLTPLGRALLERADLTATPPRPRRGGQPLATSPGATS